jgi:hypothetical protein
MRDPLLRNCITKLSLTDNSDVCSKALEFLNKLQSYSSLNNGLSLGSGQSCVHSICVELACQVYHHEVDRTRLILLANSDARTYKKAFSTLKNILKPEIQECSFKSLCVKFGCQNISKDCEITHDRCMKLSVDGVNFADYETSMRIALIFYLICRKVVNEITFRYSSKK